VKTNTRPKESLRKAGEGDSVMNKKYKIVIPGRPKPKARPRFTKSGKKYLAYTAEATRQFEKYVGYIALDTFRGKPLTGEIAMEIKLFFKDRKIPDIDNCLKSILDGLQGNAFENDRQVKKISVERFQDPNERAEIEIEEAE